MSTTTSDYMSDSSCSGTSYMTNSPLDQVPEITTELSEMSSTTEPFLRIIEEPQNRYRFRYGSELAHGCLLGNKRTDKIKSYPTVQLVNYTDKALIRCSLAQHNNPHDHPHKLRNEDIGDVSFVVPEEGTHTRYTVRFCDIGIVHTAQSEVKKKCKNMAKRINFNIVRLKFSAHDVRTGEEICAPVFSVPIRNLKSAATNDLKIVRMSRSCGSPSGGDDVFVLVEKVNKKNVNIRFFELDEAGKMIWEDVGQFTPNDVHHQYAIVFRTPAYRDRQTPVDVTVYIELLRTTDGYRSEPVEFKYKAEEFYKQMKRRKTNLTYKRKKVELPAPPQVPGTSIENAAEIADYVLILKQQQASAAEIDMSQAPESLSMDELYEDSYSTSQTDLGLSDNSQSPLGNPMWGSLSNTLQLQDNTPVTALNTDYHSNLFFENLLNSDETSTDDDQNFAIEYLKNFNDFFPEDRIMNGVEAHSFNGKIVSDSGLTSKINFESCYINAEDEAGVTSGAVKSQQPKNKFRTYNYCIEYDAFYTAEIGMEVKKLIKEICDMIKDKKGFKKHEIRERLKILFEKRLSNGDTFLHMSLYSDPTCLYSIVKIIHMVKATYLLDCCNDKLQTTLHLAVINDMPKLVCLLVAKGADPMLKDVRGYNAIHYAVKFGNCLKPLLVAIKKNEVVCNINDYNNEKQSALHMAVIEDSGCKARLLLSLGASYSVRDEHGRTPLHLAAYDNSLEVTEALLEVIPSSDVDVTDNSGNTALQIVCGGTMRSNSVRITSLLLEKKADPIKTENGKKSAWHLVKNKPALKAILWNYIPAKFKDECETDEDVFLSADEGESSDDVPLARE